MKSLKEQFLAAYDEYSAAIFRHIYYRVSNLNLAQDLTQETFFKAWRHLVREGREVENYKNFFYKIANNLIIDYYRRKHKEAVPLENISEAEASSPPAQEKTVSQAIDSAIIEKMLKILDEETRQIIISRYIDELSAKEIAKITGKTPNYIRVIIHRGLIKLRKSQKNEI